jgi:hypothetical protein
LGLRPGDLVLTPMAQDQDYLMVELRGTYYQGAVRLLTSVFDKSGIMVLVGTKSLLGEGWDAPCINTLVLASFVGSYMLSNQMRGRSIRVDAKHPEKTANIWHLVCVEPGIFGPGPDYDLLVRRCGAFAGVSAKDLTIENGTARLGFGQPPFSSEELARTNTQTMARALDRAGLRKRWQEALESGSRKEMIDGLKAPPDILPRGFVMSNTIAALLTQAGLVFVAVFAEMMRVRMRGGWDFWLYMKVVAGISAIVSLPWLARAVWRFIRHGTPERSVRQIGQAILEALEYEGSIRRRARELEAQQAAPAASAPPDMTPVANPVSSFVKAGVARYEKNMVGAAEAMPAEKYSFKPSPEMNSFGHLVMHITQSNNTFCSKISGQTAPDVKIAETDPKDKLVAALKDSFAFCTAALANVDDSKLGEQFVLFGNRPISRGGALVALGGSWTDHYATEAIYLRLNGILPPTAQPEKK